MSENIYNTVQRDTTEQKGYEKAHQPAAVCSSPPSVQSTTVQAPTGWSPEFCHQQTHSTLQSIKQTVCMLPICYLCAAQCDYLPVFCFKTLTLQQSETHEYHLHKTCIISICQLRCYYQDAEFWPKIVQSRNKPK